MLGSFECDRWETHLNIVDVVPVPGGAKELVSKSQDENVLDHLLAQVVIDTEYLVLYPVRRKCPL